MPGTSRVAGVDGGGCGGAELRLDVISAAAIYRVHLELGGGRVFDASVSDRRLPAAGKRLQKRIVRRKFLVILLQALHRGALYAGGLRRKFFMFGLF